MILHEPFKIGARLLPALQFGEEWLSFDPQSCVFYIDKGDQTYEVTSYTPGALHDIQMCFSDILSFISGAGETARWEQRSNREINLADDSYYGFPEWVILWAAEHYDDMSALSCEIESADKPFIEE